MIRWLVIAATVAGRLGGGPNSAVTPKRVADENRVEPTPGPVYSMAPTGPSPGSFSYVYDTPEPSSEPTAAPTQEPTAEPTVEPSPAPTSCVECSPSAECPPGFCCDYTIGPSGGRKLRFGSLEIGCCRAC